MPTFNNISSEVEFFFYFLFEFLAPQPERQGIISERGAAEELLLPTLEYCRGSVIISVGGIWMQ